MIEDDRSFSTTGLGFLTALEDIGTDITLNFTKTSDTPSEPEETEGFIPGLMEKIEGFWHAGTEGEGSTDSATLLFMPDSTFQLAITGIGTTCYEGTYSIDGDTLTVNIPTYPDPEFRQLVNTVEVQGEGNEATINLTDGDNWNDFIPNVYFYGVKKASNWTAWNYPMESIEADTDWTPADDFITRQANNGISITGYKGSKDVTELNIPAIIDNQPVVAVEGFALHGLDALTTVTFPQTLAGTVEHPYPENEDGKSFSTPLRENKALEKIIFADGTVIIPYGFLDLNTGTDVTVELPDSLKEIEGYSLNGITMERLSLPAGLTMISGYAFRNSKIGTLEVPTDSLMDFNCFNSIEPYGENAYVTIEFEGTENLWENHGGPMDDNYSDYSGMRPTLIKCSDGEIRINMDNQV